MLVQSLNLIFKTKTHKKFYGFYIYFNRNFYQSVFIIQHHIY